MANLLLPILAGTLPQGECPSSLQGVLNLFANNLQAVLANGRSFFSYGPDKPAPEFQLYPWLRTVDGRWYQFSGVWRAPNNYDPSERRWWAGEDDSTLVNYDGGGAGAITPTTGPMWVVDHSLDGRSPMGPGAVAGKSSALTVGETYGSAQHTLTDAEGAVGAHTHPFGLAVPSIGAGLVYQSGAVNTTAYQTFFVPAPSFGSASPTTANLSTLAANNGAGVTAAAFSVVHPVTGLFCIKPSGRQFFTVL